MTLYGEVLRVIAIGTLLALAVILALLAFRPPRPKPSPDLAAWRARVAAQRERYRHRAPAKRICVIARTEPDLRRAQIEIAHPPQRPGKHSHDHFRCMVQTTCYIHGLADLLRRDGL